MSRRKAAIIGIAVSMSKKMFKEVFDEVDELDDEEEVGTARTEPRLKPVRIENYVERVCGWVGFTLLTRYLLILLQISTSLSVATISPFSSLTTK